MKNHIVIYRVFLYHDLMKIFCDSLVQNKTKKDNVLSVINYNKINILKIPKL